MQLETISDDGHQLEIGAAKAWRELVVAANADGHDIYLTTAYRSPEHQKRLFAKYMKDMAAWERSGQTTKKPTPVAPPGRSKHERGEAVDIKVAAFPELLKWLRKNAGRFGWYETVKSEPWHWEYRP